jgi:hypothetical protein
MSAITISKKNLAPQPYSHVHDHKYLRPYVQGVCAGEVHWICFSK